MGNPLRTASRTPGTEPLTGTLMGALTGAAAPAPVAGRRWSRWWVLWLVLGYLAQVAFRLWLSRNQAVPLANPDESAYLVEARVLAHAGAGSDFSYGTLYQGGYPLALVPIYWFTSNSVTVYHATMAVNAVLNSLLMPLAYLALRRLYLRRWVAYAGAAAAALVPEGVFYTQYAMSDAIFPVVVLAWLLAVHTWLTARSWQASLGAAVLSALLAGYAYAIHSRGLVIVIGFGVVAVFAAIRRLIPAWTVAAAGIVTLAVLGASKWLDRRIVDLVYAEGPRSLTGQALNRMTKVREQIRIVEMAGGELWRLTLDTWGIAAVGVVAAVVVVFRPKVHRDLRIMAALATAILLAIVYIAPAALPSDQGETWASGRYPDAMEVTFFIVGIVVLLRARGRWLAGYGAAAAVMAVATGLIVTHYAGPFERVTGFRTFNWAEPAVLSWSWNYLSIRKATAAGAGLLVLWVMLGLLLRRLSGRSFGRWGAALLLPVLAMNVFALTAMSTKISQASTPDQRANTLALVTGTGLQPGGQVALDDSMRAEWQSWIPQSFEVWWTDLDFVDGSKGVLPAGTTVFEVAWPQGKPAQASWPQAPAGWHVVAASSEHHWVVWRGPAAPDH